jgi:hypothetical protein
VNITQRAVPWWVSRALLDKTQFRTFVCRGGLGAGKSHGGQIWDVQRSLENGTHIKDPKPTRSWTIAPDYRIAQTLIDLTFQVALDTFGLTEGPDFKFNRSFPRQLDFSPMGINHRMMFLSANNPEHFVSDSITHWRWTETAVSKPAVLKKLGDRLRDKRAKVLQGFCDSTTEGIENHFFDLAGFAGDSRDAIDRERNIRVFRVPTEDNVSNLKPGYIEALYAQYRYDPALLRAYLFGYFTEIRRSSAYYEWIESRNGLREAPEVLPHIPILSCWDFNKSPLAHSIMQRQVVTRDYERYHRWVSLWESHGECRGLMDACAEFAARFPPEKYGDTLIELYGGHDGWNGGHNIDACDWETIKKYLTRFRFRNVIIKADRAAPSIRTSLEKVAALMAYGEYVVSPECRKVKQSYAKTQLKKGEWDIEKPNGENWTHWGDGPRYCLFQLNKERNIVDPSWRPTFGVNI